MLALAIGSAGIVLVTFMFTMSYARASVDRHSAGRDMSASRPVTAAPSGAAAIDGQG
jgi:hypothetical protein